MITNTAYALCKILDIDSKYLSGEMTVTTQDDNLKVSVTYLLPPEKVNEVMKLASKFKTTY